MPAGDRSAKTAMFSGRREQFLPRGRQLETAVARNHLLDVMPRYEVIWDDCLRL
jgi:hypothetical protein